MSSSPTAHRSQEGDGTTRSGRPPGLTVPAAGRAAIPEPVREAYSSAADLYISLFASTEHSHPDDLDLFERHLTGRPGTVFDLGCGPGHLTAHLHSLGTDVVGVDMVPEFIEHARASYPDVEFRLGSMLSLDGESAAGILSWYSLIHLPPAEMDGVLAGWRRILAPGGRLVVGFFDGDRVEPFGHKVVTAYRWPVSSMAERLALAGFTEVDRIQRPGERPGRAQAAIAAAAV